MGKIRYGRNVIAEKPDNMSLLGKLGIAEKVNNKMDV